MIRVIQSSYINMRLCYSSPSPTIGQLNNKPLPHFKKKAEDNSARTDHLSTTHQGIFPSYSRLKERERRAMQEKYHIYSVKCLCLSNMQYT
jgi:hypothetical protein